MENIQNFLKPNTKSSYTNQGIFHPKNVKKYIGNVNQIYYRSGWEFEFFKWLDNMDFVERYSVENVQVPYKHPLDGKMHTYFIDVYMEIRMNSGNIVRWLIEIKPRKYTLIPKPPKKQTIEAMKNYRQTLNTVKVNITKFKAAKHYADRTGSLFGVVMQDKKTKKFKLIEWNEGLIKENDYRE